MNTPNATKKINCLFSIITFTHITIPAGLYRNRVVLLGVSTIFTLVKDLIFVYDNLC